jgi:hypothetical protein
MKSPQQAAQVAGIDIKLIRAVVRTLRDRSYLEDVYNHGANAGFPGFTTYSETEIFWKNHKKEINDLVKMEAEGMGESPAAMIMSFGCLKLNPMDNEDQEDIADIYAALTDGTVRGTAIPNALAWFALEEVARAMCEED